jgi:hypothetical protein
MHWGKPIYIRGLGKNPELNPYLKVPDSVPQSAGFRTSKCRIPYLKVPDSVPQSAWVEGYWLTGSYLKVPVLVSA